MSAAASAAGLKLLELPVAEEGYPVTGAFNDMALHRFTLADG